MCAMNDGSIHEQIYAVMPELERDGVEITELKGGITNKLYRVKVDRERDYVFRFYGNKTDMFIDREMEMQTMKLIEPIQVSPKLIKYNPELNVTVIEYIDAITLKNPDFLKEDLWEKIIRPVRLIHDSKAAIAKVFNPIVEIRRLYKILEDLEARYPEFDIGGTIGILGKIYEVSGVSDRGSVLCHNDLLAENFLLVKDEKNALQSVFLIDWEYAGMNTVYYEIADMFQEILVSREVERKLLEIYWNNKDMERNVFMTDMFKPFPDIYWFLWSLIQLNVSSIQFDYYTYGKVKYDNAQKNMRYLKDNYSVNL